MKCPAWDMMQSNADERFQGALDDMLAECERVGGNPLASLAWATQSMPQLPWERDSEVYAECLRVLKARLTPEERAIWQVFMSDQAPASLVDAIRRKHGRYLVPSTTTNLRDAA